MVVLLQGHIRNGTRMDTDFFSSGQPKVVRRWTSLIGGGLRSIDPGSSAGFPPQRAQKTRRSPLRSLTPRWVLPTGFDRPTPTISISYCDSLWGLRELRVLCVYNEPLTSRLAIYGVAERSGTETPLSNSNALRHLRVFATWRFHCACLTRSPIHEVRLS